MNDILIHQWHFFHFSCVLKTIHHQVRTPVPHNFKPVFYIIIDDIRLLQYNYISTFPIFSSLWEGDVAKCSISFLCLISAFVYWSHHVQKD